jgi:hypothetical protein
MPGGSNSILRSSIAATRVYNFDLMGKWNLKFIVVVGYRSTIIDLEILAVDTSAKFSVLNTPKEDEILPVVIVLIGVNSLPIEGEVGLHFGCKSS